MRPGPRGSRILDTQLLSLPPENDEAEMTHPQKNPHVNEAGDNMGFMIGMILFSLLIPVLYFAGVALTPTDNVLMPESAEEQ